MVQLCFQSSWKPVHPHNEACGETGISDISVTKPVPYLPLKTEDIKCQGVHWVLKAWHSAPFFALCGEGSRYPGALVLPCPSRIPPPALRGAPGRGHPWTQLSPGLAQPRYSGVQLLGDDDTQPKGAARVQDHERHRTQTQPDFPGPPWDVHLDSSPWAVLRAQSPFSKGKCFLSFQSH